jgi:hypothetical protein
MPWPDRYAIKQNPFIVGLQNFRDDLFKRFRITQRNALPIFVSAVAFPVFIIWGSKVEQDAREAQFKADFPHAPPSLRTRWLERKRQKASEAEQAEGGGQAGGEDGQEGGGDEE